MTNEKLTEITLVKEKIENLKYILEQVKKHGVKYYLSHSDNYGFNLPNDISDLVEKELEKQIFELETKFANY